MYINGRDYPYITKFEENIMRSAVVNMKLDETMFLVIGKSASSIKKLTCFPSTEKEFADNQLKEPEEFRWKRISKSEAESLLQQGKFLSNPESNWNIDIRVMYYLQNNLFKD